MVDDEDFEWLSQFKWHAHFSPDTGKFYAQRTVRLAGNKFKVVKMHQVVLGVPHGTLVDHRNLDSLDNQRHNLRACTYAENTANSGPQRNNKSGVSGVSLHKASGKYQAYINVNYKRIYLGLFVTKEGAVQARREAETFYHREFAYKAA